MNTSRLTTFTSTLLTAAVGVTLALGTGGSGAATAAAPHAVPKGALVRFTPAQTAELRSLTSTPAKQEAFQERLAKGAAAFGLATSDKAPSSAASVKSPGTGMRLNAYSVPKDFTSGITSDHFWLIASYQDIYYMGTAAATAACMVYLPYWICAPLGSLVYSFVRGMGYGANHGIWFAVYRWGYITGGRW